MRAEIERGFNRAFGKIVCGVVAGNGSAIVGKLRVAELINFSGGAAASNTGNAAAERDQRGAVAAFEQRTGICGDAPRRPLAGFVGGGLAASQSDVDGRPARDVRGVIEITIIEHQDFVGRSGRAKGSANVDAAFLGVDGDPKGVAAGHTLWVTWNQINWAAGHTLCGVPWCRR